jgi:flagellar biosynthesis protein FlhG
VSTDDEIPVYMPWDSDDDDDMDPRGEQGQGPAPMRGRSCLVAVGGGRGGVGKSLVAHNLAIYLAQIGKRVALIDQDASGSNMHAAFGMSAGRLQLSDEPEALQEALVSTEIPGLRFLPFPHDAIKAPSTLRGTRLTRHLLRLRVKDAEYTIVDVGPSHVDLALATLLQADMAVITVAAEPTAIEATYRFLRLAFMRKLRSTLKSDRLRMLFLERALTEHGSLPTPLELVRALSKLDPRLGAHAWQVCQDLNFHVAVNFTRSRSDAELGTWMSELVLRHYGISLSELGHIEYDDAVWISARRKRPLLLDNPTTKAARSIERIARRVLANVVSGAAAGNESPHDTAALRRDAPSPLSLPPPSLAPNSLAPNSLAPNSLAPNSLAPPSLSGAEHLFARPMPTERPNFYALLGVPRGCSAEEIRRAYKRKREVHAPESLVVHSILSSDQLRTEQQFLDESYDTLLDPIRRRAYDLSVFPEEQGTDFPVAEVRLPPTAAQRNAHETLLREIGPETEFSGELLRQCRESLGIELAEISAQTRISKNYLRAIEDENVDELPAPVYVRGFVAELAKVLRLDANQVQRTYLRRIGRAP